MGKHIQLGGQTKFRQRTTNMVPPQAGTNQPGLESIRLPQLKPQILGGLPEAGIRGSRGPRLESDALCGSEITALSCPQLIEGMPISLHCLPDPVLADLT